MSNKSSFMEQIGPRVRSEVPDRVHSGSRARLRLVPGDSFSATVPFARALIRRGVKGSVARYVAERLSEKRPALVLVPHYDGDDLARELKALDVRISLPKAVLGSGLAAVRRRLNLSQEQFANSVGIEVRTLQNWERTPNGFDGPTALLIKMLEREPEMVRRVAADDQEVVRRRA